MRKIRSQLKIRDRKLILFEFLAFPNTKEDIYEFVILATSNMNSYDYDF